MNMTRELDKVTEPPGTSKAQKGINLEIPSEIAEKLKVKSGQLSTKSGRTASAVIKEPMSLQLRRSDNWASVN